MNKITLTISWDGNTEPKQLEKTIRSAVNYVRGEIHSMSWLQDSNYRMDYTGIADLYLALNEGCNGIQITYTP